MSVACAIASATAAIGGNNGSMADTLGSANTVSINTQITLSISTNIAIATIIIVTISVIVVSIRYLKTKSITIATAITIPVAVAVAIAITFTIIFTIGGKIDCITIITCFNFNKGNRISGTQDRVSIINNGASRTIIDREKLNVVLVVNVITIISLESIIAIVVSVSIAFAIIVSCSGAPSSASIKSSRITINSNTSIAIAIQINSSNPCPSIPIRISITPITIAITITSRATSKTTNSTTCDCDCTCICTSIYIGVHNIICAYISINAWIWGSSITISCVLFAININHTARYLSINVSGVRVKINIESVCSLSIFFTQGIFLTLADENKISSSSVVSWPECAVVNAIVGPIGGLISSSRIRITNPISTSAGILCSSASSPTSTQDTNLGPAATSSSCGRYLSTISPWCTSSATWCGYYSSASS